MIVNSFTQSGRGEGQMKLITHSDRGLLAAYCRVSSCQLICRLCAREKPGEGSDRYADPKLLCFRRIRVRLSYQSQMRLRMSRNGGAWYSGVLHGTVVFQLPKPCQQKDIQPPPSAAAVLGMDSCQELSFKTEEILYSVCYIMARHITGERQGWRWYCTGQQLQGIRPLYHYNITIIFAIIIILAIILAII